MSETKAEPGRNETTPAVQLSPEEKRVVDKAARDAKARRPVSWLRQLAKNPPLFFWWLCW